MRGEYFLVCISQFVFFPQSRGITVDTVKMCEGCELQVDVAIDQAEKNDSWVVIEDLHLAPEKFFRELNYNLIRVMRGRGLYLWHLKIGFYYTISTLRGYGILFLLSPSPEATGFARVASKRGAQKADIRLVCSL
jgi:hypothetical protein